MKRYVLPVIHFLDAATALAQADLAFGVGADGVFLISHEHDNDRDLLVPAESIKQRYPDKLVGLNLLSQPLRAAFDTCVQRNLDMVWADEPGVSSSRVTQEASQISLDIQMRDTAPLVFASVAFKYQEPVDPNPPAAALAAAKMHMIPTTSGDATGSPPTVEKIRSMRDAIGSEHPLAIASGMSPENIADFTPYATHFLVATGVSVDAYHFDEQRLARFVELAKGG